MSPSLSLPKTLSLSARAAIAGLMLAAAAPLAHPGTASAGMGWCWDDPVIAINGRVVHVDVGVLQGQQGLVTSSSLVVTVPTNVTAQVTGVNAAGFPITVSVVKSGTWSGSGPIQVKATGVVNASSKITTGMQVTSATNSFNILTTGTSGQAMTATFGM